MSADLSYGVYNSTEEPVLADEKTLIVVFKLSLLEGHLLSLMLSKPWVDKHDVPEITYALRQAIYMLRRKVEPIGMWIVNDGAGRYSIADPGKLALARAVQKALVR